MLYIGSRISFITVTEDGELNWKYKPYVMTLDEK